MKDRESVPSTLKLVEGILVDFGRSNPNSEAFEHQVAKVQKRIIDWGQSAIASERERCAKIADEEKIIVPLDGEDEHYNLACDRVAGTIRRGEGANG